MKFRLGVVLLLAPLASFSATVVPIDKVENHVNVRLEADAASEVVGRLKQGDALQLVGEANGWYEVVLEGDATGFISADWTRVVADEASVGEASTEPDPEAETVVEEAPREPAAEPEPLAAEAPPEPAPEPVIAEAPPEPVVVETPPEPAPEPVVVEAPPELAPEPVVVETPPEPIAPISTGKPVIKGKKDFLVRFKNESAGGSSQVYDDGNRVGIGTTDPQQRLEVNGSIQIHEQNSSVAGLMITQASGETGYIMHNRASTLTIGAGSQDRITIDRDGNVGIAVSRPNHPLEMASGAHVTLGGVWTNRSSRDSKHNIQALGAEDATAALLALKPVLFEYRNGDPETYAGFIAEDVPDLVAMQDRESLSAMDIVAVLTRVVQEQQQKINELEARLGQ